MCLPFVHPGVENKVTPDTIMGRGRGHQYLETLAGTKQNLSRNKIKQTEHKCVKV